METNINYNSQLGQDRIALELLDYKKNGVFLDIGCSVPDVISNTLIMEKHFGWKGLVLDNNSEFESMWSCRPNSKFICADATAMDWKTVLSENNMPQVIDFLSLDLEPPQLAFTVLKNLPFDEYQFNVIAFEHDDYRGTGTKEPSRIYLIDRGYTLVCELNGLGGVAGQDDIWIHNSIIKK
jgi:hypothetical protein